MVAHRAASPRGETFQEQVCCPKGSYALVVGKGT